ncbi:Chaperone protein dnaj 20 protein [Thalictrum thalictroides]|uniref:Chaperone protein dnaj 20 protein n=1 Tax=Thalictrum thalictroides TaxID=46969 RepID=A0A7J6X6K8_THATH|nr:Chaperone protein dnaj 20 protein [Thalictrum thalictroides]
MDISSCHLYSKQIVPIFTTTPRSLQKTSNKLNLISCRATTMEPQRVTSSTNFYEVLSIPQSEKIGFDDIKKAYRSMARQYHPDVVPASRKEESTKRFIELQKAYETLSDPILRQKYDYELGFGYLSAKGMRSDQANYSKDVWEDQLRDLQSRSYVRMSRKKR